MRHSTPSGVRLRSVLSVGFAMLLCGFLLAWAQIAQGHAALVGSDPIEGTVLGTAPPAVSLGFSEPVGPLAFKLIMPDGGTLEPGPVQSVDNLLSIMLPPVEAQGTYLLSWRVVSADGHPVGGVLSYAVGAAGPAPQAQASTGNTLRDAAIWTSRLLLYLCLIASVGAALFRATSPGGPLTGTGVPGDSPTGSAGLGAPADRVASPSGVPPQDWVRRVIPAGLVLMVISLALQGLDALDAPWTGLARADTWRAAFDSRYAGTLGFAAMALAAAYRAQDSNRRWVQRTAAAASALLLGVALANSGHAGTAPPQWLAQPAVALHVIAVTAWLGALIPLAHLLRSGAGTPPRALARFSCWITPVVGVLLLSGATMVWLQLEALSDLWRTPYGRILAAKLALVAMLLLVAAVNRYRYTRPALAGEPRAREGLLRMIVLELVLAVSILGLVSLWRFTPPPRSLHAAQAGTIQNADISAPAPIVLQSPQAQATLRYQTADGPREPTELIIALSDPAGDRVMDAVAVSITLSNPQADLEALRREGRRTENGTWEAAIPPLPEIDGWQVRLDVRVDDFTQFTLEGAMEQSPR